MKRIVILGCTGSIGRSSIEIAELAPDDFEVVGLAAGRNIEELSAQLKKFPRATFTVMDEEVSAGLTRADVSTAARCAGTGTDGIVRMIRDTSPDLVVNALVGISGLIPTMTALGSGCDVALANKETLVTAGQLVMSTASDGGAEVIPVDSEHFSISRCLDGRGERMKEIILTASGGPFFGRTLESLEDVTVAEVLDHPTWTMGSKVTVDSAHLMNKGLEVIEAHHLFGYGFDEISVVIHPQSLVHSLTRMRDGSLLAHLGPPDMRLPIMNAMYYPQLKGFPWGELSLEKIGRLDFLPLDEGRFPAYSLALGAAKTGGTAPAVLNAADEVAVTAFLSGEIGFLEIVDWIEEALEAHTPSRVTDTEDVLEADRWTREFLAGR
ncbi:MAG TPA: 1-deoxy-D-xylulose-5-phosphate reductoisomerase [Candidatus Krumholzibacterium sp.]|nr:1-deoxy-D-xylulose-5-phosphate reductoisomerase [Candidatus Krumholzibacterium sp.]